MAGYELWKGGGEPCEITLKLHAASSEQLAIHAHCANFR